MKGNPLQTYVIAQVKIRKLFNQFPVWPFFIPLHNSRASIISGASSVTGTDQVEVPDRPVRINFFLALGRTRGLFRGCCFFYPKSLTSSTDFSRRKQQLVGLMEGTACGIAEVYSGLHSIDVILSLYLMMI